VFYGSATFSADNAQNSGESEVFRQTYDASEVRVCASSGRAFACAYESREATRDDDAQRDVNEYAGSNETLRVIDGAGADVLEFAAVEYVEAAGNSNEPTATF
jgi:hypothetical protein